MYNNARMIVQALGRALKEGAMVVTTRPLVLQGRRRQDMEPHEAGLALHRTFQFPPRLLLHDVAMHNCAHDIVCMVTSARRSFSWTTSQLNGYVHIRSCDQ